MCLIQQVVTISTTKNLFYCLANSMKIFLLCFPTASLKTLSSSTGNLYLSLSLFPKENENLKTTTKLFVLHIIIIPI